MTWSMSCGILDFRYPNWVNLGTLDRWIVKEMDAMDQFGSNGSNYLVFDPSKFADIQ